MVGCESSDRRPQHLQMCAYRRCRLAEWGWLDCNIELKRRRRTAERSVWAGAWGWGLRWRKRGRGRDPRFRRRVVEQLRISAILCIAELGLAVNPYSFCKDHVGACHDSAGGSGMVVSSGCITAVVPVGLMRKSRRSSPSESPYCAHHHL